MSIKTNKRCFVICPNPSVDILANIPAIKAGASNRIQSEKRYPGGKGIHVAMALAELEIPTTLIGLWGDKNGKWLIDACKTYYPALEVIGPQVEGWNRSCYTFQSDSEWQDTEILGTGPTMNEAHFEQLKATITSRKDEIDSVAICGSWAKGALPEYNKMLTEHCRTLNIKMFLDCTGEQLKHALTAKPFCIHLNRSEVTQYFDTDFDTAKNKLAQLCKVAAITDGAKGLYLYTPQEDIHANVKISDVKSTVGSGDCLMAGIIAGFYLQKPILEIAKMGAACGAANCLNEDLGILRKKDVNDLFSQVKSKLLTLITLFFFLLPQSFFAQGFANVAEDFDLDFSYSTVEYGGGVSFVDFNQDGLDDLTFTTESGVRFFMNIEGTDFVEFFNDSIGHIQGVKQALWVDYNNDELLDLYLTSEAQNKLYRNNGDLNLEDVSQEVGFNFPMLTSYCSTWFDYDNDGKLDLLVAHRTADKTGWIDLYRNVDYNSFEKNTIRAGLQSKGESVLAMTAFDYNNDGWQDIFLGQDWEKGNMLFKNNGNGTFTDVSVVSGVDYKMNSMTATVMDINEDGWQDLYVSNTTMGNVLLVNDGAGSFEEKAAYYNLDLTNVTFGTVFFDADNDADNDFHIGGMQINHTFEDVDNEEAFQRRNNDWGFYSDNEFNNGVATGDFNNDGFIDIVKNSVTRGDFFVSKNSLWQNNFSTNNYIKIQLRGTVSNHFAIGAKIMVYANGKVQHKRMGCGESFSSQHSLTQHFGVGQTETIDSILVQWTANNTSVLTNITANQTILMTEPPHGCTDTQACNYQPSAQYDNGSCRYAETFYDCRGCIDDSDQDGVCDQLEVYGCDEQNACNFSLEVTENDGTCYYLPTYEIIGPDEHIALEEAQYTYPTQAGSRYEWTIENGSILGGNQTAEVTVIWYEDEEGELSVHEIDALDCTASAVSKTVQITPLENEYPTNIRLSPNPVHDRLTVHNINTSGYIYLIYNTTGQLIRQGILDEFQNSIDMTALNSGLYILEIRGKEQTIKERIYKK